MILVSVLSGVVLGSAIAIIIYALGNKAAPPDILTTIFHFYALGPHWALCKVTLESVTEVIVNYFKFTGRPACPIVHLCPRTTSHR